MLMCTVVLSTEETVQGADVQSWVAQDHKLGKGFFFKTASLEF